MDKSTKWLRRGKKQRAQRRPSRASCKITNPATVADAINEVLARIMAARSEWREGDTDPIEAVHTLVQLSLDVGSLYSTAVAAGEDEAWDDTRQMLQSYAQEIGESVV